MPPPFVPNIPSEETHLYDYTLPGGFPFTQQNLEDLQKGYFEPLRGLANIAGNISSVDNPMGIMVLWGMEKDTGTGYLSEGGILHPEYGYVPWPGGDAGSFNNLGVMLDYFDLTYADNNSQPAGRRVWLRPLLTPEVNTFRINDIPKLRWSNYIGARSVKNGTFTMTDQYDGTTSFTINYQLNSMTGQVWLRGYLQCGLKDYTGMSGEVKYMEAIGTMPSEIRPKQNLAFPVSVMKHYTGILEDPIDAVHYPVEALTAARLSDVVSGMCGINKNNGIIRLYSGAAYSPAQGIVLNQFYSIW